MGEQQQTGHSNTIGEELRVIEETLKWHGIIGGAALAAIITVGVWFNIQQMDTRERLQKLKGQVYYFNKDIKRHLEKDH